VDVAVRDLPPALAGRRIGHLSDFHVGAHVSLADVRRALDLLASASPDLVVITGDFVDHRPRDIVPTAQALADLSAPLGVYGVLGNHDHRVGGRRLLAAIAEHAPMVRMLVNSACRVPLPDGDLCRRVDWSSLAGPTPRLPWRASRPELPVCR
jgi:predicted MPP superfamily phosphohydrolase